MQHWGLKLYTVYTNHDPWLTLTYFTARSTLVVCEFESGTSVTVIYGEELATNDQIDITFMLMKAV